MKRAKQRTLIVYGNCQAQAVTAVLEKDPIAASLFRVVYVQSFDHPVDSTPDITAEELRSCALLLEQHDRRAFPYRDGLPQDATIIKFPSVDLNVLWPFNSVNPYSVSEPPVFPFGRFPYGDRVVLNCLDGGMSKEAALDYYLTAWDQYKPDLRRLTELEVARIKARDARCDVKMGEFVLQTYKTQRPFWTVNHPTSALLSELIERIVQAAGALDPVLSDIDVERTMETYFPLRGPLGIVNVPIHPKVAEFLELSWYDYNEPIQNFDLTRYSYEEYFRAFIAYVAEKRAA